MSKISGFNHITFSVHDLDRSIQFYHDILGCDLRLTWRDGAYLTAGDGWICLIRQADMAPILRDDYSHFAFSVSERDYATLSDRICQAAPLWQDNVSEGPSLYFLDPDNHRLELHIGTLQSRIDHYRQNPLPDMMIHGPV